MSYWLTNNLRQVRRKFEIFEDSNPLLMKHLRLCFIQFGHDLQGEIAKLKFILSLYRKFLILCRFQEAQMSQTTPANAFGGQVQGTTPHSSQANSPKTDSFSLGSPSETMSRKSALSAFEESLKQPALTSNDSNVASPLSESIPQESRTKSMPKFSKRTHRRSTSEPVAIENWNLIKDQSAWKFCLLICLGHVTSCTIETLQMCVFLCEAVL